MPIHVFSKVDKNINPENVSNLRTKAKTKSQLREMSRATTKIDRAEIKKRHGLNDTLNPLLNLSVDLNQ